MPIDFNWMFPFFPDKIVPEYIKEIFEDEALLNMDIFTALTMEEFSALCSKLKLGHRVMLRRAYASSTSPEYLGDSTMHGSYSSDFAENAKIHISEVHKTPEEMINTIRYSTAKTMKRAYKVHLGCKVRNSAGTWVQSRVRPMVAKRISSLITHDELLSLLKDEFQLPDNTSVQYVLLNTKNQVIDPGENF
ncbi:hypothetical protein EB796_012782 [Bugula neritina]|uniref:Uncharacterized protein n=1 Tax=Bugula neritina TaxID=10212 RepID=A0A7J7JRE9_BUGNE|nr:hypothetical protein EB796_012782 [Bugula neritina]